MMKTKKFWKPLPVPFKQIFLAGVGLILLITLQVLNVVGIKGGWFVMVMSINYMVWVGFSKLVYSTLHYFADQKPLFKRITLHVLASFPVIFLQFVVMNVIFYLVRFLFFGQNALQLVQEEMPQVLFKGLASRALDFWLVTGFFIIIDYYQSYHQQKNLLNETQNQLTLARLEALKMQLNPHFLFNTLHTVHALIGQNTRNARKVLTELSELLRIMLNQNEKYSASLQEEITYIKKYLNIEQTRFEDRLKVIYHLEEDTLSLEIPYLILQPLVENALKHGIAPKPEGGTITVSSKVGEQRLTLTVTDDGIGYDPNKSTGGIGVKNVRQRLTQLYADNYTFQLASSNPSGCIATITIPAKTYVLNQPSPMTYAN